MCFLCHFAAIHHPESSIPNPATRTSSKDENESRKENKPMSFDLAKPLPGDDIDTNRLRTQFNGLKYLIGAIPAGPPARR